MSVLSDREEGEIVDDDNFEYILSSDEENVRQRIQELEEKNYELEQIAQISGVYSNAYIPTTRHKHSNHVNRGSSNCKRSVNVPPDVSLISSVNFDSSVLRNRRTRYRDVHKRKHRRSRSRYRHRYKNYARKDDEEKHLTRLRAKIAEELDTILLESEEEKELTSVYHKEVNLESRLKFHYAVTRKSNLCKPRTNIALKERLLHESNFLPIELPSNKQNENQTVHEDQPQQNEKPLSLEIEEAKSADKEDSLSEDEQELRLIALKSAILNKHMARKQRNAEIPYSPTDFDDLLAHEESFPIDDDNMELDVTDLVVGMDISPALSPAPSSTSTGPVDMDIAQSDSDLEDIQAVTTTPNTTEIPTPPNKDNWQMYNDMDYAPALNFRFFMPEINTICRQPPSPLSLPPPPPPPEVEVEQMHEILQHVDENKDAEEEERALRALLLSAIHQTKAKSKILNTETNEETDKKVSVETEHETQLDGENFEECRIERKDEREEEDNVGVPEINVNDNPTAAILKQAVLRLRKKALTPTNVINETATVEQNVEEKYVNNEEVDVQQIKRPKLLIRSVATINEEFLRQKTQICESAIEVIEEDTIVDEIVISSDSDCDENNIKMTSSGHKNNALRDSNCNTQQQQQQRRLFANKKGTVPIQTTTNTTITTTRLKTIPNVKRTIPGAANLNNNRSSKTAKQTRKRIKRNMKLKLLKSNTATTSVIKPKLTNTATVVAINNHEMPTVARNVTDSNCVRSKKTIHTNTTMHNNCNLIANAKGKLNNHQRNTVQRKLNKKNTNNKSFVNNTATTKTTTNTNSSALPLTIPTAVAKNTPANNNIVSTPTKTVSTSAKLSIPSKSITILPNTPNVSIIIPNSATAPTTTTISVVNSKLTATTATTTQQTNCATAVQVNKIINHESSATTTTTTGATKYINTISPGMKTSPIQINDQIDNTKKIATTTTTATKPICAENKSKTVTNLDTPVTAAGIRTNSPITTTTNKLMCTTTKLALSPIPTPNTRLITTTPSFQVPKLVISLECISSDDSDNSEDRDLRMLSLENTFEISDMDFLNHDNASPISLPMDSPRTGTPRCISPLNDSCDLNVKRTVVNDLFQQRLDDFLKNARTSVITNVNISTTTTTPNTKTSNSSASITMSNKSSTTENHVQRTTPMVRINFT